MKGAGSHPVDLAIPMFGYKNHTGIDRAHGLIRSRQPTLTEKRQILKSYQAAERQLTPSCCTSLLNRRFLKVSKLIPAAPKSSRCRMIGRPSRWASTTCSASVILPSPSENRRWATGGDGSE